MEWDFALAIRTLRKERHLTRQQLSKLSGISKNTIIAYERGAREPTAHRLGSLAKAMRIPINKFYDIADMEDCDEVVTRLYFEGPAL